MSAGDRSTGRKLLDGAAGEPVMALFVVVLLLMALGFLVAGVVVLSTFL
ncbi:hypothetical protein [Candidatus Halobonum tyrrellensis]|nr:hypothetical protein [Candidatus Halobonum tyrrellensis]